MALSQAAPMRHDATSMPWLTQHFRRHCTVERTRDVPLCSYHAPLWCTAYYCSRSSSISGQHCVCELPQFRLLHFVAVRARRDRECVDHDYVFGHFEFCDAARAVRSDFRSVECDIRFCDHECDGASAVRPIDADDLART